MCSMRKLLTLDVLVVLLFVVLGRETHDEGNAIVDALRTAAPFLIALVVGWVATRNWPDPTDYRLGLLVAGITVAGGMLLRRVAFDDGTAIAFVIVATVFNLAGMAGWRYVASRLKTRSRRSTAGVGPAGDE